MEQQYFSTSQVAKLAGVKMHQLIYAISNGNIPDASTRFLDKRLFTETELQSIVAYFVDHHGERREEQDETRS